MSEKKETKIRKRRRTQAELDIEKKLTSGSSLEIQRALREISVKLLVEELGSDNPSKSELLSLLSSVDKHNAKIMGHEIKGTISKEEKEEDSSNSNDNTKEPSLYELLEKSKEK